MFISLANHAALITGSTQGIGFTIAKAITNAGGDVCLHGLKNDAVAATAVETLQQTSADSNIDLISGDLSATPESIEQVFQKAIDANPDIDLLVNNAGTFIDKPFLDMDFETFDQTLKLNVYAYYFLAQKFAQYWIDRGTKGRILLIGSINGRLAEPDHSAYDTSKGAVEMMVKTLCVALSPHKIRVNGIAPGLFVTPLTSSALNDRKVLDWMKLHTPNGEVPGPEVCGEAAVYLLSDSACHIQGHMMMIDGGMSVWQQPDRPDNLS